VIVVVVLTNYSLEVVMQQHEAVQRLEDVLKQSKAMNDTAFLLEQLASPRKTPTSPSVEAATILFCHH
jgi:hypothetical protein